MSATVIPKTDPRRRTLLGVCLAICCGFFIVELIAFLFIQERAAGLQSEGMGLRHGARGDLILVSADPAVVAAFREGLSGEPYRLVAAATSTDAVAAARSASAELAIIDSRLEPPLDHAAKLLRVNSALGFMLLIGEEQEMLAVEAARKGAYDFIMRPVDGAKARFRVRVALEKHSRAIEERAYTV